MLKITLLFFTLFVFTYADTIDKKKVLAIIKAAKKHKAVPTISKPKVVEKKDTSSAPLVVYRKRTKPIVYKKRDKTQKVVLREKNYGVLPTLAPSSVALKREFQTSKKTKDSSMHFHAPPKKSPNDNGMNTVARKINF